MARTSVAYIYNFPDGLVNVLGKIEFMTRVQWKTYQVQ